MIVILDKLSAGMDVGARSVVDGIRAHVGTCISCNGQRWQQGDGVMSRLEKGPGKRIHNALGSLDQACEHFRERTT